MSARLWAESAARIGTVHATLVRGSDFLSRSLRVRAADGQEALTGDGGARVVGNGLRELDRFLNLLLDEAAAALADSDFDHRAYVRQSNVANKLGVFHGLAGLVAPDAARLRAIGRVRACLHHCRGIVHDPALWGDLRVAAGDPSEARSGGSPDRLAVTFGDLARICRFYVQAGDRLMAACRAVRPVP